MEELLTLQQAIENRVRQKKAGYTSIT